LDIRVKNLARSGKNVVGTIQYLDEQGVVAEYSFNVPLKTLAKMSLEEFRTHALNTLKDKLEMDYIEEQWARVQRMLEPIVVEEEREE